MGEPAPGSGLAAEDADVLDAEPLCVGRGESIDGRDLTAWVVPSVTWRGRYRWTPQVERYFVGWAIWWRGRRYRSHDKAKARALTVLQRLDRNGGRRER